MNNLKIYLAIVLFILSLDSYAKENTGIIFKCPIKVCYGISENELNSYMDAQVGKFLIYKLDKSVLDNISIGKAKVRIYLGFDIKGNVYSIQNSSVGIPSEVIRYLIELVKDGKISLIYPVNGATKKIKRGANEKY